MRRILVLFPLAVALLFAAAFLAGPSARAQDATPAAAPSALPPLLREWVDAVNAHDTAAFAALYAEDGTHEDVPSGTVARGREEVAALFAGAANLFSDFRIEPVSGRQAGELAVLEYVFSATDLETGQPLTYRGVLVFDLDDTLIRRSADYYDVAAILGQLGLLDMGEPTSGATPTP